MTPLKGHFDGAAIILDDPAELAVGQPVHVILIGKGSSPATTAMVPTSFPFDPHPDPTVGLMTGSPLDERDAVHIDPLDQVPSDFVRQPGSGRGEVRLADDFDATPAGFEDDL
jgi:hypothetical protein